MDTLQLIGLGVGTALLCVAVVHFWRQGQTPDAKEKTPTRPPSTPRSAPPDNVGQSGEPGSVDDDREFEDKETGEKRKAASSASSLRKRRKNLLEQERVSIKPPTKAAARVSRSPGADNRGELNAILKADKGDPLGLWKGKPTPVHAQGRVSRKKKSNRPPIPAFAQLIEDEVENASPPLKERKVGEKAPGRDTAQEDIDELFATVRELRSDSGEKESLKPIRKKPRNNARPAMPSFDAPAASDNDAKASSARPAIPSFDAPSASDNDENDAKASSARPAIPSFDAPSASDNDDNDAKASARPAIPSFDAPAQSGD